VLEYLSKISSRGYVKSIHDIENVVLRADGGTPILVKDVAAAAFGPEMRRGVADSTARKICWRRSCTVPSNVFAQKP
jgi:Cu/Ag efflux pump CusA